eukprot:1588157-Pleurochrysis_carterae.AAC.1
MEKKLWQDPVTGATAHAALLQARAYGTFSAQPGRRSNRFFSTTTYLTQLNARPRTGPFANCSTRVFSCTVRAASLLAEPTAF